MVSSTASDSAGWEPLIIQYHEQLTAHHPGLKLRWSRIYGKRWSHFLGNTSELAFFPFRMELNDSYGLSIENPDLLSQQEFDLIIELLKGAFSS